MSEITKESPINSTQTEISGLKIHESVFGHGPNKVIALHGWTPEGNQTMNPLAQKLDPDKFTVYVPSMPGFEQSQQPPESWSVNDYVDKFLLPYISSKHLDEKFSLIGHSFGGRLSIVLASEQPQMIKKLILIDSAGIKNESKHKQTLEQRTLKTTRNTLRHLGLNGLAQRVHNTYVEKYGSEDYKRAHGIMQPTLVKVVNQDLSSYAKKIQCPTLILWGSEDEVTPISQAEKLRDLISENNKDCGLHIYEGAGHYSHLDRLDATSKATNSFLN